MIMVINGESDEELLKKAMEEYNKEIENVDQGVVEPLEPESKENQFKLMRDILKSNNSLKTANLSHTELGEPKLCVRGCLNTALLCRTLGLNELATCYEKEAEIIASTSMSKYVKSSNFLNLIFTQIRKSVTSSSEPKPERRGIFNFGQRDDK